MTNEKPILFKPELVKAILDGQKTQTRRVVKPQPEWFEPDAVWQFCTEGHGGRGWYVHTDEYPDEGSDFYRCPYGEAGDRLWVREAWACGMPALKSGRGFIPHYGYVEPTWDLKKIVYKADWGNVDPPKWRPSIHMPRRACRLVLEIVDVRVERLQEITPQDAKAEGDKERSGFPEFHLRGALCHVDWFRHLWNSIHNKDGFDWKANPWVWVITFKQVQL